MKLADFGVSSRLGDITDDDDPTQVTVVGTPYWMAPEVPPSTPFYPPPPCPGPRHRAHAHEEHYAFRPDKADFPSLLP